MPRSFLRLAMFPAPLMGVAAVAPGHAADFPVKFKTVARSEVKPNYRARHALFSPRPVVAAEDAGLVGDGKTDNTDALRKLFEKGGQSVKIGPGDIRTGRFVIPGDTLLTLSAGTILRDTGHLGPNEPLVQIYGSHVNIVGNGAKILENRADCTRDQGRHGVAVVNVSDVSVGSLGASDTGGDGFYIGGPGGRPATDVSLINWSTRNIRRQGLSIINARRVDIINSTFSGSSGNKPEIGVDLEPNQKSDVLDGILLHVVRTLDNHGGGVLLYLNQLGPTSEHADIEMVDHRNSHETPLVAATADQSVAGAVRYIRVR